jgi:hypothetical protein
MHSLTVRNGTGQDLSLLYTLFTATARRQGFTPPPAEYFHEMWHLFAASNAITLFIAERHGEPVSAELDITFGDTLVSKRAG